MIRNNRRRQAPGEEQLPPHAPEAERGALGACLQKQELVEHIAERIKHWGPLAFYLLPHQVIWQVLVDLRTSGKPVDIITASQALRDAGKLEEVGGLTYLNELEESCPSPENWSYYLDSVVEKYLLRQVTAQCVSLLGRVRDNVSDVSGLIATYQGQIAQLAEEHTPQTCAPQKERLSRLIDTLERRHRGRQEITGLETPFWYLNNMTAGLQAGELIVVGARPSTGKTALGVDLSMHALRKGLAVLFFSIEMSADQIDMRMLGNEARINGLKLRNGFWRDDAEPRMAAAFEAMAKWPFYLDDRSRLTGQDVLLTARRVMREVEIRLIVIDYVQLMSGVKSYDKRHEELGEVSRWLKQTAKETGVPVVALAQLNRDAEKDRGGRQPLLSDLKDCGSFEQDADVVGLLWEPKIDETDTDDMKWLDHHTPDDPKYDETEWRQYFRRINLTIAKNRNGPTGPCELVFQRSTARFVDAHSPNRGKAKETLL